MSVKPQEFRVMGAGRRSPGIPMWCVIWKTRNAGKPETWGFIGSLTDVIDLAAALREVGWDDCITGCVAQRRSRAHRAAALTRARLRRDPERRKRMIFMLMDVGYLGPLT